jgi:protein subunit release factor A
MNLIPENELKVEVIYLQTETTERPGGQHAGTPASSIRITHLPSGVHAQCGACRSQHKNKVVAIEMLEAALTSKWGGELR